MIMSINREPKMEFPENLLWIEGFYPKSEKLEVVWTSISLLTQQQVFMLDKEIKTNPKLSIKTEKNPLNGSNLLLLAKELTKWNPEHAKILRQESPEVKKFFGLMEIFKDEKWNYDFRSLYSVFPAKIDVKNNIRLLLRAEKFEDYINWIQTTLWNPNIKVWFDNVIKWNIAVLQNMVNTEKYAIRSLTKKSKIEISDYSSIDEWIKALKNSTMNWDKSYLQVIEEELGKNSIFIWGESLEELMIKWAFMDTSNLDKINTKIEQEKDNLMKFKKLVEQDWEVFKLPIQKNYRIRLISWEVKEVNEKYTVYINTWWNKVLAIKNE